MRSHWVRVDPDLMTGILRRRENTDTRTEKMEAETGGSQLSTKGGQGLLATEARVRLKRILPQSLQRNHGLVDTLNLKF